jgi:tetratricopeptide (TPR) repeat protein
VRKFYFKTDLVLFRKTLLFGILLLLCYSTKANQLDTNYIQSQIGECRKLTKARAYDNALLLADSVLQNSKEINYNKGQLTAYRFKGYIKVRQQQYAEALEHYNKALRLLQKSDTHKKTEADLYLNFSSIYSSLAEFETQLDYLNRALKIYKELEDKSGIASCLNNIGNVHHSLEQYADAKRFMDEAYQIINQTQDSLKIARMASNLANQYFKVKDYEKAAVLFNEAINLHKATNNFIWLSETYLNYGISFHDQSKNDSALFYLSKAIELGTSYKAPGTVAHAHFVTSLILRETDRERALQSLEKAYGLFSKKVSINTQQKILKHLAIDYQYFKKYEKAYTMLTASTILKDSIMNMANLESANRFAAKYKLLEKESELEIAEGEKNVLLKEKELANRTLLGVILIGLLIVVIAVALILRQKDQLRKKALAQELAHKKEALAQASLKSKQLEMEKMELLVKSQDKKITSLALNITNKKEMLEKVNKDLSAVPNADQLKVLVREIRSHIGIEEDQKVLSLYVDERNREFINKLKSLYPGISENEMRLAGLLRLNLSSKEISSVLNIASNTVDTYRYNLRKRLDLKKGDSLHDFLSTIG